MTKAGANLTPNYKNQKNRFERWFKVKSTINYLLNEQTAIKF